MSAENGSKRIENPSEFLRETGLLFEINREVMHPLGLAIAFEYGDETEGKLTIIDERDDPEGFLYEPETFISALEKFNTFLEDEGLEILKRRQEHLGFTVQSHPDPYIKENGLMLMTSSEDGTQDIAFRIPYNWAKTAVYEWFGLSIDTFIDGHTPEQAEQIYADAKEQKVILSEEVVREANE